MSLFGYYRKWKILFFHFLNLCVKVASVSGNNTWTVGHIFNFTCQIFIFIDIEVTAKEKCILISQTDIKMSKTLLFITAED